VCDDGAGFDPKSADRLLQPFQRPHPTAEFPGNGVAREKEIKKLANKLRIQLY
jgi:light-regulated signal transduction histidine kinase (bacteriophytochrome)